MHRASKATSRASYLIKKYEGLRLVAYLDGDRWALGYGESGSHIREGMVITELEADAWLHNRIGRVTKDVLRLVKVPLSQGKLDALVSFVYNVGTGAFAHSHLLRCINQERWYDAASEILKWDKDSGDESEGLKRRRLDERILFDS